MSCPYPPTQPSPSITSFLNCPGDSWANTDPYLPLSPRPLKPTSPPPVPHLGPPAPSDGPLVQAAHLASQATGPDAHPGLWSLSGSDV